MHKGTWYYASRREDQFAIDVECMVRCGVETVILNSPSEETTEAFLRCSQGRGIELHVAFELEHLYETATGRRPPPAVTSRQEELLATFPDQIAQWLFCWSSVRDASPLVAYLEEHVRGHPFAKGINLDKLRYPNTVFQEDFPCECEGCQERREPWLGRGTLTTDDLRDPSLVHKEIDSKRNVITNLARRLASVAHGAGLEFSIAARAVYAGRDSEHAAGPTWGYGPALFEGQDWAAWCREGLLDRIHFMNYTVSLERFERLARRHKALLAGTDTILCEGLGIASSAGKMSPETLGHEIEIAERLGIDGVTMFNWSSMTEEHMRVLERTC